MIIRVSKISGFCCYEEKVIIFDNKGKPFYYFPNEKKLVLFNLPQGVYKTNNKLEPMKEPVLYKLPSLPAPERKIKLPDKIKIRFGKNKNKCSVYLNKGVIIFDKQFHDTLTKPSFCKILFHEIGHYFYGGFNPIEQPEQYRNSEMKCDIFANYMMLKRGFNPSQCYIADATTLSDSSEERKAVSHFYNKSIHAY